MHDDDNREGQKGHAQIKPGASTACYIFVSLNVMLEHAIGALVTGLCPLSCPVAGNACGDVFR